MNNKELKMLLKEHFANNPPVLTKDDYDDLWNKIMTKIKEQENAKER